ncbi:hypothetical protein PHLGIDRAFT_14536 [Phlebiopsis gigantea 11061_1 CR5-6]|uniref:Uncharacterized protein n=1 Tax=Phlebiopsis gigantea (strain 11061_1 CR5-6) TaxID=745531 RepID=A0A0C3NKD5_PHLG1|nr:hypothetical protein PHLGIDRAFT_14536 [Phlebiopsis gigantea 11061_1 CR5-6]
MVACLSKADLRKAPPAPAKSSIVKRFYPRRTRVLLLATVASGGDTQNLVGIGSVSKIGTRGSRVMQAGMLLGCTKDTLMPAYIHCKLAAKCSPLRIVPLSAPLVRISSQPPIFTTQFLCGCHGIIGSGNFSQRKAS